MSISSTINKLDEIATRAYLVGTRPAIIVNIASGKVELRYEESEEYKEFMEVYQELRQLYARHERTLLGLGDSAESEQP